MLVNGRIVQEKEDDLFIEFDLREGTAFEFRNHAETEALVPYVDDAIFLWEMDSQIEYWAGANFVQPPYGKLLVVNHTPPRTDAILFQSVAASRVVQVHAVAVLEHTEPDWSLHHAVTSPNCRPLFQFDLGDLNVDEAELRVMSNLLEIPDLDHHYFTLAFAVEVIRREVAANRACEMVEGYMSDAASLEDFPDTEPKLPVNR